MQGKTECHTKLKFTTLSSSFSPSKGLLASSLNPLILFNTSKDIIAAVSIQERALVISLFHVATRKPLYKKTLKQSFASQLQAYIKGKNNLDIIVLRSGTLSFQFLSLRLELLFKLDLPPAETPACLCSINGKVITWYQQGLQLSYWNLFESKPHKSLALPYELGNSYSLLPHRNLLILISYDGDMLLFIDVSNNQMIGTTKNVGNHLQGVVNIEDRVITSSFKMMMTSYSLAFYSHQLTNDLELKQLWKIDVNGYGSKLFIIAGGRMFLKVDANWIHVVEVSNNKKVISQKVAKQTAASYVSYAELKNYEKTVCVLTERNKLLLLQIKSC